MIKLIELFAGYGSQALALKYLGYLFQHQFVCEFNNYAIQAYNDIHGTNFTALDIRDVNATDLKLEQDDAHDCLITYSFPCTDLSIQGKQRGMRKDSGTRSSLVWEVHRILLECAQLKILPKYLIMENVDSIVNKLNVNDFALWIRCLKKLNYKSFYKILNAADYGIPQRRRRCFMVSILQDCNNKTKFSFPLKKPLFCSFSSLLEKNIDFSKYVLSSEEIEKARHCKYESRCLKRLDQTGKIVCDTLLFKDYSVHGQKVVRLSDGSYRRLTPREYFRLMGVRDEDYDKLTVSDPVKYALAGNSIVVNVLMEIFRNLLHPNNKIVDGRLF